MEETTQESCRPFQRLEENEGGGLVQLQETITVAVDAVDNTGAEEMVIGVNKAGTMRSKGEQNEQQLARCKRALISPETVHESTLQQSDQLAHHKLKIFAFYVATNDKEAEGEEGVQQAEQGEGDEQTVGEELAEGANETEGVTKQADGGEGDDEVFINPVAESMIVGPAELVIVQRSLLLEWMCWLYLNYKNNCFC